MVYAFLDGVGISAALIIAIGAQNAFVLIQGIRRNHHIAVGGLCALLDILLITIGILGVGIFIESNQVLRLISSVGGCLFLLFFGIKSLCQALKTEVLTLDFSIQSESLAKTLLQTLAISLLNPHVYLDTVVMLGSISATYQGDAKLFFGLGSASASILWFFSLAQAGKILAPIFTRPKAWKILHCVVCLTVWWIAYGMGLAAWKEIYS